MKRRNRLVKLASALAVLAAGGVLAMWYGARTVQAPPEVGAADGTLAPCASSLNCAASQQVEAGGMLPPLTFADGAPSAQARLLAALRAQPRTEIIEERPGYVHVVFRSPTIGFPNDAEFTIDAASGTVRFRSQARLGREDMGKNREYLEQVAADFAAS